MAITGPSDISIVWNPPKDDPQAAWHRADPVLNMVRAALVEEVIDQEGALKLDADARQTVARAQEMARGAAFPAPEAAFADALSGGDLWPR